MPITDITTGTTADIYKVSRDNGVTWSTFPENPNKQNPEKLGDAFVRIDATQQIAVKKRLTISWGALPDYQWYLLYGYWNPLAQNVLLAYTDLRYTTIGGVLVPRWYTSPAVWAEEPTYEVQGPVYFNVTAVFDNVEWAAVEQI